MIHAFDRRTDGQTDRQTEFSSLDHICIPCSAVIIDLTYFKCQIIRFTLTPSDGSGKSVETVNNSFYVSLLHNIPFNTGDEICAKKRGARAPVSHAWRRHWAE